MNNEIVIRTNKGEYHTDSHVYGAVYLHVCRPTEAHGIKVTFRGEEKCLFEHKHHGEWEKLTGQCNHVEFFDVPLYSQKDVFEIGRYVFPFKFELSKDVPGSFTSSKQTDEHSFNASVTYSISACAIGAEDLKAIQPIVVYPVQEEEMSQRLFTEASSRTVTAPGLLVKKKCHITAKLLDNFTERGSNLQIRIIITNESKLKLTGFSIKLMRDLKLKFPAPPSSANIGDNNNNNMHLVDDMIHIQPEGGPKVIRSAAGSTDSLFIGSGGLDRLQLPLSENLPEGLIHVPSSVSGKYVKNQYGVEVSVSFSNNHTETFILNIPGVLPKPNSQWSKWRPPDWAFHCDTKLSSCIFSVTEQMLRTQHFSGLPMFQVL